MGASGKHSVVILLRDVFGGGLGVAQMVSRGRPDPVVTVAELMRRCASAPESDDYADPIPVAALLRREGRSAEGLPVPTPAVGEVLSALPVRHPIMRRGKIAAGALLAAGSVFGLTALNVPATPPSSSGVYPDQGLLFPTSPSGAALDAGNAAPTSWLPVAFPTAYAQTVVNQAAASAPVANRSAATQPAAALNPGQAGGQVAAPAAAPAQARTNTATQYSPVGGLVGQTTKDVGDTVSGLDNTVNAVGGTVSDVGDTVSGLDNTVSAV